MAIPPRQALQAQWKLTWALVSVGTWRPLRHLHVSSQNTKSAVLPVQEAAAQVEKVLSGKGLDVLINNAGTSEDLVPPLDTWVLLGVHAQFWQCLFALSAALSSVRDFKNAVTLLFCWVGAVQMRSSS